MKPKLFIDVEDISDKIIQLILKKYPNGYSSEDIISIKNLASNYIKVIEVESLEFIYFIKISVMLETIMDNHINKDTYTNDDDY